MSREEVNIEKLGKYVRARRHAKGLSLRQAERRSGVDLSYWSRLELGETRSPSPRHLALIARTIDVPVQELYGLAGYYLPEQLPSLAPYLRAKYGLDAAAISELQSVFEHIQARDEADRKRGAA